MTCITDTRRRRPSHSEVVTPEAPAAAPSRSSDPALRALLASPLFGVLAPAKRQSLLAHSELRALGRSEPLFERGAPAAAAFVVVQGRVECVVESASERRWTRAVLGPGGTWGLPAVIDGQPYGCSARALGRARALVIPAMRIRDLMEEDRRFALAVLRLVTAELRRMIVYAGDVTLHTVRERLAAYLLRRAGDDGRLRLDAPQARIAAELGTVREVVARLLRAFEREGVIARDGRALRILDPVRLRGDLNVPLPAP